MTLRSGALSQRECEFFFILTSEAARAGSMVKLARVMVEDEEVIW